ncbi:MAG TPA: hypothetical protein VKR22_16180 [Acidimicrobiales bacterium]|nr:hypothetical protein [Acidimicrobiales bacterium]
MTRGVLSVRVEFDLDAHPIGGTVVDPAGTPEPFHGWLELTEKLEAVRNSALSPTEPRAPSGKTGRAAGS